MGMNGFRKVVEVNSDNMFCLVLGDTTPARHLYDALAAGCIPVVIGKEHIVARNLPFKKTIDWLEIALYGGSSECMAQNIGGEQELFKSCWRRMRARSQSSKNSCPTRTRVLWTPSFVS
eukprot:gnl/MRDRNA2_/MRDRNA2_217313_c0_seq1.p1 gnl/MRDRNA2_/MRDRNA2_217313_c0~~gnl/MRDRNA2_/MRDRNA2_217313_c0_seq1.p1  ORF type:complete len:119 (-),score=16.51 gnl/MRDRNA2_/MRDRNA2_217313_c0_seq1:68-424(-)